MIEIIGEVFGWLFIIYMTIIWLAFPFWMKNQFDPESNTKQQEDSTRTKQQ